MTGSKVSIFDILNEAHAYYLWPIKASFGRIRLTMTVDPNQHILQHTFNWIVDTHYTPITILHNPVIKGPNEFEKKKLIADTAKRYNPKPHLPNQRRKQT